MKTDGSGRLRVRRRSINGALLAITAAATLTACSTATETERPVSGGTLRYLKSQPSFTHLDPQRNFLAEDVAFASAFLQRTLTAYTSPEAPEQVELAPDLAVGTGEAADDATRWSFDLRDGLTFADGAPITCADVKYGVSRAYDPQIIADRGIARGIELLDVPIGADGRPAYHGPYAEDSGDVAAFDDAVRCSADDRTITFHLAEPAGDFPHVVTSHAFAPVPVGKGADADYDIRPVSSGPYRIDGYVEGSSMTLVRNERWDAESDPLRPAYPDRIEVELGLDQADIDQRLRADDDADHAAIAASALDPVTAAEVAGAQALAERTIRGSGLGVRFIAVNTERLPVLQHRRAILTALDRSAVHDAAGGDLTGRLADGLIPPYVSADATTEQPWTDLLGRTIPPDGDPGHARELIADLGRPMPALQLAHGDTTADRAVAEAIARSLRVAGIDVEPVPLPPGEYQPAIRHPHSPYELMLGSWFPAWMDASTVITELLTPDGGAANLSRYDVPGFTADAAQAAAELDGAERASMWAALDARAVADAAVIPLRFDRQLRLVGSQVRGARVWAPYGSTAYAALWVAR